MNVFLSWSGESSKAVATALNNWLKFIFSEAETWMSDQAIEAGARWGQELDKQLDETNFGVICLSSDNMVSPWLLFEAGALSKRVETSHVVPYCIALSPDELLGPLSRFQGVRADKDGTLKLLRSINSLLSNKCSDEDLKEIFDKRWPDLESKLKKAESMVKRGPGQVTVRNVLMACTQQYEELGAEEELRILEKNYPGTVKLIKGLQPESLLEAMNNQHYEVVHLLGHVDPSTGAFVFEEHEQVPADGLLRLLQNSQVQLVFLSTCDSLVLGAKLARHMSVVAAIGNVSVERMIKWEKYFYNSLSHGNSLSSAYETAQSLTADVPMMLIIRNDALFLPITNSATSQK